MAIEKTVPVLVPIPADEPYSYCAPEDMSLAPGDLVRVPLGSRQITGVVWHGEGDTKVNPAKLRLVIEKFDCPAISSNMRKFIEWVASYTLSPAGMVLKMVLSVPTAYDAPPPLEGLKFTGEVPEKLTKARNAVMEFHASGLPWTRSGLAHASGVSTSVVDGLVKAGVLETVLLPPQPLLPPPQSDFYKTQLSADQAEAALELQSRVNQGGFSVTLLEGVTGSGKTEVYFEALAACFEKGNQALVLIPEIALTSSFLDRFEKRFRGSPR